MSSYAIPPINGISHFPAELQHPPEKVVAASPIEETSTQTDLDQAIQAAHLMEQKITSLKELVKDLGLEDSFLQDELVSYGLLRERMECFFSAKAKQLERKIKGEGIANPSDKFADLISKRTQEFKFYPLFSREVSQIIESLSSSRNHPKSTEDTLAQLNQLTQAVNKAVENHMRVVKVETYLKCQLFMQYCGSLDSTPTTKDFTDEMRVALKIQIANALKLAEFVAKSDIDGITLENILQYAEQTNGLLDDDIRAILDEKIIELKQIFHERGYIYRAVSKWSGYQKCEGVEKFVPKSFLRVGYQLSENRVPDLIENTFEVLLTAYSDKIINEEFSISLDDSCNDAVVLLKAQLDMYLKLVDVAQTSIPDYTAIKHFFFAYLVKLLKGGLEESSSEQTETYRKKLEELLSEIVFIYQLVYDVKDKHGVVSAIKAIYGRLEGSSQVAKEELDQLNRLANRLLEQLRVISPSLAATLEQNLAALKANFIIKLQGLFEREEKAKQIMDQTLATAQAILQKQQDKAKQLTHGTAEYHTAVQQIDQLGKSIQDTTPLLQAKIVRASHLNKILTETTEFYPTFERDIDENYKLVSLRFAQNPELKLWANIFDKQFKVAQNLQIETNHDSQVDQLALKEGVETVLEPLSDEISELIEQGIKEMTDVGYFKLSAKGFHLPFPPHVIVPVRALKVLGKDLFEKLSESELACLVVQVYQMVSDALLNEYAEELQDMVDILPIQEITKIISIRNQVKDYQRQMAAIDLTVDYANQIQTLQDVLKQVGDKEISYKNEIEVLNKAKAIVVKNLNNAKLSETVKLSLRVKLNDLDQKIVQTQSEFEQSLNASKRTLNSLGVKVEAEGVQTLKQSIDSKLKQLAQGLDFRKQYDLLNGKLEAAQDDLANVIAQNLERQPSLSEENFNTVIDDYEDLNKQIHMRAATGTFKLMGFSDFEIFNIR